MLGIFPLVLAPMSETFGRRPVFLVNLAIFTLLQIPTALGPNIGSFIALRTLSGVSGSVGVANGGGSVSDLFQTSERATVLGYYLLGPLLGPTLGPLIGAVSSSLTYRGAGSSGFRPSSVLPSYWHVISSCRKHTRSSFSKSGNPSWSLRTPMLSTRLRVHQASPQVQKSSRTAAEQLGSWSRNRSS